MFAERLKQAMHAAGYEARPAVLERLFNLHYLGRPVTYQAVRRWLRGDSMPEQDKLQVLAEQLGIEPHVLRYGQAAGSRVSEPRGKWEIAIGGEEHELLQAYRKLPDEQRQIVRQVMLAFLKAYSAKP
ncbi:helix-turn-helix domain-containing protein [Modicisalibacter tunisiensis]|uniref:helix-turn-helix domain-containing protein n=1 Tax=Modicisalibacter tunisiensis TaxID=390637 RepID=UPI001CCEC0B7|nr:helix-turn-helix domain-containing protein [Modicisalibacter tunisiensis]